MKATLANLLQHIPGPRSDKWPDGERFAKALSHGTMSVEVYAPFGHDPQTPHEQDELYFVMKGTSEFMLEDTRMHLAAGDAVFVPAGAAHRFERFSDDFVTWVVFWGPKGGET
ncbi:cupin domain-containing protein [Noviherbaspirillum sp.]|uniref:cupin domain-containing protein n=1 Tax=Noviherbaspirillum sp. TaxID=1926288 RepID=UPI002FE2DA69